MRVARFLFLLSSLPLSVQLSAQVFADFTMDKTGGCSPVNINFTNLTSGASASAKYSWDFGNGNMSFSREAGKSTNNGVKNNVDG